MTTNEKNYLTDDDDDDQHDIIAAKRTITVIDDDDDQYCQNKRHRGSTLTPSKPLTLINKPVLRNSRQTSLSIIRTNSENGNQTEGKWNLKMIAKSSLSETTSKQQKKKTTRTVNQWISDESFSQNLRLKKVNGDDKN